MSVDLWDQSTCSERSFGFIPCRFAVVSVDILSVQSALSMHWKMNWLIGTLRVGQSLMTWAAFLTMAFSSVSSLGILGVGWNSVNAGFTQHGRSCCKCNMSRHNWSKGQRWIFVHTCQFDTKFLGVDDVAGPPCHTSKWLAGSQELWYFTQKWHAMDVEKVMVPWRKRWQLIFVVTKWGASRLYLNSYYKLHGQPCWFVTFSRPWSRSLQRTKPQNNLQNFASSPDVALVPPEACSH